VHTGAGFHDVTSPKEEVTVAPIEEQNEWESRKLWFNVSKGIREGDFESAATSKGKIEVRRSSSHPLRGSLFTHALQTERPAAKTT